jgi:hypothetical protein
MLLNIPYNENPASLKCLKEKKKKSWERKLTIFKIIPMSFLPKYQMLLEKLYLPQFAVWELCLPL